MDKFLITQQGYESLKKELDYLKNIERPKIVIAIAEARSHGDLSENGEYKSARENQTFLERKIADLENKCGRAEIIEPDKDSSEIRFGAHVELLTDSGETIKYFLAGNYEADPGKGIISVHSPLGRAILGLSVGEVAELTSNSRKYEVKKIWYE